MEAVKLTFKYTQAEYVKADRLYLIASKTISRTSIVVLAIFLPASLLYLFLSSFSVLGIIAAAIGVIVVMMGSSLYFYMPSNKFKITSKYHEEYTLTFSNSGITFKTPSSDRSVSMVVLYPAEGSQNRYNGIYIDSKESLNRGTRNKKIDDRFTIRHVFLFEPYDNITK